MQSLNESLSLFLKAVQKKSGGGIPTNIGRPELIHSFDLEKENLLTKEVIMGIPKLKINFLPSCGYAGCTASHSQIHVRERVEFIDDLKRYDPVMIKGVDGEEIEDKPRTDRGKSRPFPQEAEVSPQETDVFPQETKVSPQETKVFPQETGGVSLEQHISITNNQPLIKPNINPWGVPNEYLWGDVLRGEK